MVSKGCLGGVWGSSGGVSGGCLEDVRGVLWFLEVSGGVLVVL